jgi:hypothetical protein
MPLAYNNTCLTKQPAFPSTLAHTLFCSFGNTKPHTISDRALIYNQNSGAPAKKDKAALHTAAVEHTKTSNLNKEPQDVSHNMGDKSPAQHTRFTNQEMLNQEAIDTAGIASARVIALRNYHRLRSACKHSTVHALH